MKADLIIFRPNESIEFRTVTGPVEYDYWTDLINGLIEIVPGLDHWITPTGSMANCIAFANEEGKLEQLPINHHATAIWHYILANKKHRTLDVLVGPVVLIFGDDEFMEEL